MPAHRYRFPLVENATRLRETSLSLLEGELNCSASLTFYSNGTFLKFNSSISIIGTNQIYSEKEFIPDDSGIFVCEKPPWYDLYDIRVLSTIVTFTISVTCLIIAFLIHFYTKTYKSTHDKCILSFFVALFFAHTASLVPHMNRLLESQYDSLTSSLSGSVQLDKCHGVWSRLHVLRVNNFCPEVNR